VTIIVLLADIRNKASIDLSNCDTDAWKQV